jgi:hypothetical protein
MEVVEVIPIEVVEVIPMEEKSVENVASMQIAKTIRVK